MSAGKTPEKLARRAAQQGAKIDNTLLIVAGLLKEAGNGNVPAAKELRSIIGEDQPPDNDSESLKKARELLGGIDSAID